MKNDLPYFSHDNNARNHPKMKALIAEFGYEGYGRFWALNERIAETSGAYIDISRKVNKLDLAKELGFDGAGLDNFLGFLSDPEIDLINIIDGKITTDRINELYSRAIEKREKRRKNSQNDENPEVDEHFGKMDTQNPEMDEHSAREEKRAEESINLSADIPSDSTDLPSFSTANAVDRSETVIVHANSCSSPKKSKKLELSPEQLPLFHAAKACFEISERSKMLMYQDKDTAAREMKALKLLVIRCGNMAPGIAADFLRNVLEHFRTMCSGKLHGKAVFTPTNLTTNWIWGLVIDSLPENNITPELHKIIKGLFK